MPSVGTLRISMEQVQIAPPITKNFERLMLINQAEGKKLLAFEYIGGGVFNLTFGKVEGEMETETGRLDVVLKPWQVYLFNPSVKHPHIQKGDIVCNVRLAEEYNIMEIGDPIEVVSMAEMRVVGEGTLVGLQRVRLGDLTPELVRMSLHTFETVENVRDYLEHMYEQEISYDDLVTILYIRNTGAPLPHGHVARKKSRGLFNSLVNALSRLR